MKYDIRTITDNGTGMEYFNKEDFIKEISLLIDDCITNGGTRFYVEVFADASCFLKDD